MDPSNESKNNCSLRPARETQAMDSIAFGNGFNNKPKINLSSVANSSANFQKQNSINKKYHFV